MWAVRKTLSVYSHRCYFPSEVTAIVISTNISNSKAKAALERKSLNHQDWLYPLCRPRLTNEIKNFSIKSFSLATPLQTPPSSGLAAAIVLEWLPLFLFLFFIFMAALFNQDSVLGAYCFLAGHLGCYVGPLYLDCSKNNVEEDSATHSAPVFGEEHT